MPKTSTSAAVKALQNALAAGHTVTLTLGVPPHIDRTPLLATACRQVFGMTRTEAMVFVALLERGHAERETLQAVMSSSNGNPAPTDESLSMIVGKVRRKLASHGVTIGVLWGQGYIVGEGDRVRVRKLLAEYGQNAEPASVSPD